MTNPTSAPPPEREECAYKHLLILQIKAVISELLKVHTDEFENVLNGNYDTRSVTEDRLRMAREKKALLIERYRDHVMEHRC
jgi:hypothetical protein